MIEEWCDSCACASVCFTHWCRIFILNWALKFPSTCDFTGLKKIWYVITLKFNVCKNKCYCRERFVKKSSQGLKYSIATYKKDSTLMYFIWSPCSVAWPGPLSFLRHLIKSREPPNALFCMSTVLPSGWFFNIKPLPCVLLKKCVKSYST